MSYGGSTGGNGRISTSTDVSLSNPANAQVLTYDTSVQKWKNAAALSATVDGNAVTSLTISSAVAASDVGALALPTGTPTVGQVPTVTAVSPLALGWSTPTGGSSSTYAPTAYTNGEATFGRESITASVVPTSGQLLLSYFTAIKSESAGHVRIVSGATAASGLTLAKVGLYSVNASTGALTLVASTANTTSLATAQYTAYQLAFSAAYTRTAGSRYAIAALFVGSTMPSLVAAQGEYTLNAIPPRVSAVLASQSDLPSSIADSSLSSSSTRMYGDLAS